MDYEELNYSAMSRSREFETSLAFPVLMRKVYLWMTLALVITGLTAYYVATSPTLIGMLYSNPVMTWVLPIATLVLVLALSAGINKMSLTTATIVFTIYSVLMGATFSSIFLIYDIASITQVFFITAGTFAAMAAYGHFTKSDLNSWGRYLFMALIGLIIATLVNVFFIKSAGMDLLVSYVGVLIFVGLTAYDSQKIKVLLQQAPDAGEHMQKYALLGALTLYLDFINLFIYLLRILGSSRE